ncbi:MAG: LuxR C-terminal-related transcriptional regulator, partial [Clostridiales Family XIII bacterium]|nr:LuxR C-terminal-related transcriptional regulator [Clostridiales Family XIII bacterium]
QEKRFLTALGQGLSQSDAAEELGIAPRTARGMAERVAEKLGASGKNDALKIAKQMRII